MLPVMFEILSPHRMQQAERYAIDGGIGSFDLMRAAGQGVVRGILEAFPGEGMSALVLCGPGNNGGDGYVVAALLAQAGWNVRVAALVPPEKMKGDAARAARMWTHPEPSFVSILRHDPSTAREKVRPVFSLDEAEPEAGELVVDALFGTGFSGALPPPVIRILTAVRQGGCAVVAVDIPSGVDAASGVADPATPDAVFTVTFFRKKTGHALMPGLERCGPVQVEDIGIPDAALGDADAQLCENAPDLWLGRLGLRITGGGNKYDRGHAVILAGPRMTGAAMMAAHAACRAGVGLCTVVGFPDFAPYFPNMMSETIERFSDFPDSLSDPRRNLVLLGPGAGREDPEGLREAVRVACVDRSRRVVLDADALNAFADNPGALFPGLYADSRNVSEKGRDLPFPGLHEGCVLTPHEGEFARLFPSLAQGPKIERARKAAFLCGATVVLKGPDTVIAAPDGRVVVNTHASADLATGGSGDVLAGLILGFLGRGGREIDGFSAACAAAWVQGEAALRFGPGLMATDLPDMVPGILKDLRDG